MMITRARYALHSGDLKIQNTYKLGTYYLDIASHLALTKIINLLRLKLSHSFIRDLSQLLVS